MSSDPFERLKEREKKRERIWKVFVERITPQERRFRDEIAKLFEEQRKVVLANLAKLPKAHHYKLCLLYTSPSPRD